MNYNKIDSIRNKPIEKYNELINESIRGKIAEIKIQPISIGGWTSINLLASNDSSDFVVKLPAVMREFSTNPYEYAFSIADEVFRFGFSTEPIFFGRICDNLETPFAIYKYAQGHQYSNLSELSKAELDVLISSRTQLSKIRPMNIRSFYSASTFLDSVIDFLGITTSEFPPISDVLKSAIQKLDAAACKLHPLLEVSNPWPLNLMHGDFQLGNIVFSGNKITFLDFEECALGNSLYDLAYILMESEQTSKQISVLKSMLLGIDESDFSNMCNLALFFIITWTVERLIQIEHNIVESFLSSKQVVSQMNEYLNSKIHLLNQPLHNI